MPSSNNNFFILLILLIIPIGIFFWWKKKKKRENEPAPIKNKKTSTDNEAWQTVKKYLKEKNEYGKEIISLFAVKRKTSEELKNESKEFKQKYKEEVKAKKAADLQLKQSDPQKYKELKKREKRKKDPELWLLVFTTRDTKTNKVDDERIIEAEIIYEKISKKRTDRKIVYHDNVDYDKEIKWIKPLKDKDDKQKAKQAKIDKQKQQKQKAKEEKKRLKKEVQKNNCHNLQEKQ